MPTLTLTEIQADRLNQVFSRSYYSAAGYVYESRPYLVHEDAALLDDLRALRLDDRQHATLLARLLETYDEVPAPGTFAYWYRDLNYLTLPYMLGFVVEALQDDIEVLDEALAAFPEEHRLVHTTLRTVRRDKEKRLGVLLPLAAAAAEREGKAYSEASAAVRKARLDREAQAKAAKKGAKGRAAAPRVALHTVQVDEAAIVAGLPDPFEAGISMLDRTKRKVARLKAIRDAKRKKAGVGAPAAAVAEVDWRTVQVDEAAIVGALPDPAEAGLEPLERTKRKVARLKAVKDARKAKALAQARGGMAAAPAAADITPASLGLADPDEPGIPPKEKAKRQIAFNRAKKKALEGAAASAEAAPAAGADLSPAALGVADPDEPGIPPKEQGRRRVLYNRARKKAEELVAAAPAAPAPAAAAAPATDTSPAGLGVEDPDEPGLSPKEQGKRRVLYNRALKKAQGGAAPPRADAPGSPPPEA